MKNQETYGYHVACINTLLKHGLITNEEYKAFEKHLKKKFNIFERIGD